MSRLAHSSHVRGTGGAEAGRGLAALVVGLALLGGAAGARGDVIFLESANPTGLPDITQNNSPIANGGICAAAAAANIMWNWSESAPFDGSQGGMRLVDHPNSQNPAQNWPNTFGNWAADSITLRNRLVTHIYGTGNDGHGEAGGMTRYIEERGHLYSSGFFGFGGNPNGLSVRSYHNGQATYSNMYGWLLGGATQRDRVNADVMINVFWHNADGTTVQNMGDKSRHALVPAGLDAPDPANNDAGHSQIYLTNGWGSQQNQANPVSTAYYDRYTNIVIDNSGGGNPDNKFRIPTGGGAHNGGQGNDFLVHGIANSNNADYVEMYRFIVVKQGGSPEVGLEVAPENAAQNRFTYQVYNPELTSQEHFYLELDLSNVDDFSLTDVISPEGWGVEFWNPAGTTTNPGGSPADGTDLFGPAVNAPGSDFNLAWEPAWGGLHWYWMGASGSPITTGLIFDFAILLGSYVPYTLDQLGLTVVGEHDNEVLYYNMIGGPRGSLIPEPSTLLLTALGLLGVALRTTRANRAARRP